MEALYDLPWILLLIFVSRRSKYFDVHFQRIRLALFLLKDWKDAFY